MSSRLSKLNARIWRHKYFWTIVIFSVHLGFIDANSLWYRYRLTRENKATLKEIAYYEKSFENDRNKLKRLSSDPEALIRVARENHQMKAADEDVYYIVENSDSLPEAPANP
ncbi:MAG: septum formation initiator family protein [Bacteroidaceae bacterium]|nr:septum formation initiator family protein [Bacteroidaceae bacterium]